MENNLEYLRPTDRIYEVVLDKDNLDWKFFLHNLIYSQGIDPWDIDLPLLTKKYLEALKNMDSVDFNLSGKFLTIAVFLLKVKAENLIEVDIRGLESKIENIKTIDDLNEFEEGFDFDEVSNEPIKKKSYKIIPRNPLARKRKVNIFDLIKTLEKTFEQSNKRKVNFFLKNSDVEYSGPIYEKKPKDLKVIIEELYLTICDEFKQKSGKLNFSHLIRGIDKKEGILDKFIPLLHLHNQLRVTISQDKHLGDIEINKTLD